MIKHYIKNIIYILEGIFGLDIWLLYPFSYPFTKSKKGLTDQARKLHQYIEESKITSSKNEKGSKFCFIMFSPGTPKEIRLLISISKVLAKIKNETLWLVCRSTPKTCEYQGFKKQNILKCYSCTSIMTQVLNIFNERYIFSDHYNNSINLPDLSKCSTDELIIYMYKSINVGEISKYSLYKTKKTDIIDNTWKEELVINIHTFITTYESTINTIEALNITDVVIMGGMYLNYRAVMHAAQNCNINYHTYENFGVNRLIWKKNDECFKFKIEITDKDLSPEDIDKANELFKNLKPGLYYHRIFNSKANDNRDLNYYYDNYIALFPNVSWDSATFYKESTIFESQYDWIFKTIGFCITKNINLVIRIHPGEAKMKGKHTLSEIISTKFKKLPSNITIIMADDKASSYNILNNAKAAIVFVSTIGIEIPFYDTPCIVVGDAYYKNYGFTYNPDSFGEYYEMLHKFSEREKVVDINVKDKLYKYVLSLDNYRRYIGYGEYYKYTGREEIGKNRGHSFDFDKSYYQGYPYDNEQYHELIQYITSQDTNFNN